MKIMKTYKSICVIGVICGLCSCSDFSDYNEAPADQLAAGNQTLWQNIEQNQQLSDFAALVRRAGFDRQLDNTHNYTVWAPLNGTFDAAAYQALDDSTLLQQFVKGHVAQYSYLASGQLSERVHMLNNKSFTFEGQGSYTFGELPVSQANVPGNNGVMHLINGAARFYPNLYEYIMANQNDSLLRQFFKQYELTELDTKNSVKGPVVGGIQTYVDSVLTTSNTLLRTIGASLTNEDSTYTFLLPSDKAWQDLYDKVKPCFNFIATTAVQDVDRFTSATSTTTKSITVNAAYLSDSLTRRAIIRNLAFSNNDEYNKWIVDKGEFTDTMRSTNLWKFSNPREILSHAVSVETMSNGYVHTMDSLAFFPWETYLPELEISPMYNTYTAGDSRKVFNFSSRGITVSDPQGFTFGPDVTEYTFLWIYPKDDYSKPELFLNLPGVMSTTYKFYCVFLPGAVTGDERPNILNFQLNYCGANGKVATYAFSKKFLDSGKSADANPKTLNKTTAFENDPLKCDTVYLGDFTFPVAYNGLGDYSPNLHISNPISVFNKTDMANYTRDLRLAYIIMKPIALAEYEEKEK